MATKRAAKSSRKSKATPATAKKTRVTTAKRAAAKQSAPKTQAPLERTGLMFFSDRMT